MACQHCTASIPIEVWESISARTKSLIVAMGESESRCEDPAWAHIESRALLEIVLAVGGERAVWAEWNALPDDCPAPVKTIARHLAMEPADVAFIVYPAETFGRWADDQEPE
jgi:hypothetical protein